ncbi:MAG TPA: YfhO family protein, partial [Flavobacterium sp.]|nr:YfhO family protein [Flavobacterium sp.]
QSFFKADNDFRFKSLGKTAAVCLGLIVFLFLVKSLFSFTGPNDDYYIKSYGPDFVKALKADRRSLYSADLLRSGFFILVSAGILWMHIKDSLKKNTTIILIGLLMVLDLFFIDKNYVSGKDFVSAAQVAVPFEPTQADMQIMQDTSYYRVFEVDGNLSSSRASYFHKSIGGYSAVKPRRMQQLFDYQISNNNMEVINMLNVKYIIQTNKDGKEIPSENPDVNGNAWFVKELKLVNTPDEEMKALDSLDSKNIAIVNQKEFGQFTSEKTFAKDSLATIRLVKYKPNDLKYISNNPSKGVAVFSESYYKNGWNAYIDGKKAEHFRADYLLRALSIPAGKHQIEFKFEPEVVKTGSIIALISSIGMLLLIIGGLYYERRKTWYLKKE